MAFEDRELDVPTRLAADGFVLRPLRVTDVEADYEAVMETRELLRHWEQSTWPADDFTVAANRRDLERHEQLHHEGRAFTYTVMDPAEAECLGCVYVFPTDATFLARSTVTDLGRARWADQDAAVYLWVRQSRLAEALDRQLLDALRIWLVEAWDLGPHVFVTNERFEQQVAMLAETDLELRFRIAEPGKPGRFLAYGEPAR